MNIKKPCLPAIVSVSIHIHIYTVYVNTEHVLLFYSDRMYLNEHFMVLFLPQAIYIYKKKYI